MPFTQEQLQEFLKGGTGLDVQSDFIGGPTEDLETRARRSLRNIRENEVLMKAFHQQPPAPEPAGPSFLGRLFHYLSLPGRFVRRNTIGEESFIPMVQRSFGGDPNLPPLDIPLPYTPVIPGKGNTDTIMTLFGEKAVPKTGTPIGAAEPAKTLWEQITERPNQDSGQPPNLMPPRLGNMLGAIGGTGLDIVSDPLTYLGLFPELPAAAGGGRALIGLKPKGVFSGPTETVSLVKGQPVQDAITTAIDHFGETAVGKMVGKAFIPHFGLPKGFRDLSEESRRKVISAKLDVDEMVDRMYSHLNPDELKYAALATEYPELLLSKDLVKGITTRGANPKTISQLKDQINPANVDLSNVQTAVNEYNTMRSNYQTILKQHGLKKDEPQILPQYFEGGRPGKAFKDPVEAMNAGFTPELDLGKVSTRYANDTERRMIKDQLLTDSIKQFGERFRPQDPAQIELLNKGTHRLIRDHVVPNDLYASLVKTERVFGDEQASNAFLKFYDNAQNWWKGNVTVTTPGFHIRNSMGNAFNMWLAGVNNPKRFAEAADILNGGTGKFANTMYTKEEVLRLAQEYEVYKPGGAFMEDILGGGSVPATKSQLVNPFSTRFAPVEVGREVGSSIENNARIALFLDRLVKGATPKDAAITVKKYLFDYGELTPLEQGVFKRVVPFYTWMRKNVALQAEHLLTQPGKADAIGHLLNADPADQAAAIPYEQRPKYMRGGNQVALPAKIGGLPAMASFDLPIQDLDASGDITRPFSPLIKDAYELSSLLWAKAGIKSPGGGFGEAKAQVPAPEITKQILQSLPEDVRKSLDIKDVHSFITGKSVPGLDPRIKNILSNSIPLLGKLARVLPTDENLANPAYVGGVTSTMTGVRVEPVDVRRQKAINTLERKKQLEEQLKIWFKEGQIDATQYGFARRFLRGR